MVGASQAPAISVSFYDVKVEGVEDKLAGHINPGELVAILGDKDLRNETLKMLAGKYADEVGQVMIQGIEMDRFTRQKHITYIDSEEIFMPQQTVNRSLMIPSKL